MQLPKDLLAGTYMAPRVILCETDKTAICELDVQDFRGTFKFNSYSEIECAVSRTLTNIVTGVAIEHPYYDKIEAVRLLYVPGFGYFEIQDPQISSDGIQETKSINAFSLEYTLSQKYIENFIINNPDVDGNIGGGDPSVINQIVEDYSKGNLTYDEYQTKIEEVTLTDPMVQFYNIHDPEHSLLHLALQKAYGWSVAHVDSSLVTQSRSFEVDRTSIYDFLMNDVAETFKCYFIFDTNNNTISVYAEAQSEKLQGDGTTTEFYLASKFPVLGDVTIDGYRTTEYTYSPDTGKIVFKTAPANKVIIEVFDNSQSEWQTDVVVSFENLVSQMDVEYSADDIKTILKVTGSDDMDIRDVNMGLDYIMDLSYFNTPDWMGQELYDKYNDYLKKTQEKTPEYTQLLYEVNELWIEYDELQHRTTTEVVDPDIEDDIELKVNLTNEKLNYFQQMLQKFYKDKNVDGTFPDTKIVIVDKIKEDFIFLKQEISDYIDVLQGNPSIATAEAETYKILDLIWDEYGVQLLKIKLDAYTGVQQTQVESEWSQIDNDNYYMYWANYMMLDSCQKEYTQRVGDANTITIRINELYAQMQVIADDIDMYNGKNFSEQELVRLSAFMREDEYSDDNFLITDTDTNEQIFQAKKELLQCGKIELSKLSAPKLSFSADMANIYAIEDFAPIVHQFQLGNLIRVVLRQDYVKWSRLMEIRINFDDLSDFSVTFGELTAIRTQADLHAELLQQAASAGKSVASNSSYWNKSADKATATDLKIQQGLINATTSIKSNGSQAIEWDQYGLHVRKWKDDTKTEYDPKQMWICNNSILFSSDNWKTSRTGVGEFTVNGETFYGVCQDMVISQLVEGAELC